MDTASHARTRSIPRLLALALLAASPLVLVPACSGPPVASTVEGEPLCPDYELGATRTKMQGSLRHPVMLSVLDGSTSIVKLMILGRRSETDPHARILLSDSNEEYTVEWAQCENERAPRPVTGASDSKESLRYECGTAAVYSTEKLVTKKGDMGSHALKFPAPPKNECWVTEVGATGAAGAGVPDGGAPADDAGAPGDDAGMQAAGDGGAETDAGADAAPSDDAGAASTDAGPSSDAGEAPAKDAGSDASAGKKKPASK